MFVSCSIEVPSFDQPGHPSVPLHVSTSSRRTESLLRTAYETSGLPAATSSTAEREAQRPDRQPLQSELGADQCPPRPRPATAARLRQRAGRVQQSGEAVYRVDPHECDRPALCLPRVGIRARTATAASERWRHRFRSIPTARRSTHQINSPAHQGTRRPIAALSSLGARGARTTPPRLAATSSTSPSTAYNFPSAA